MTRILARRIQNKMESENRWTEAQSGFRPGRDTTLNIAKRLAYLAKAGKESTWVTFIDLRKAYDSIPHWAIAQSLRGLGFHENTVETIREIYRDNVTQIITPWGLTNPLAINLGVRQGDPLSPILFNMVLDPILNIWERYQDATS